jgi:hypothetical protein
VLGTLAIFVAMIASKRPFDVRAGLGIDDVDRREVAGDDVRVPAELAAGGSVDRDGVDDRRRLSRQRGRRLMATVPFAIVKGIRQSLRGEAPGRAFGVLLTWTIAYLSFVGLVTIALVATAAQGAGDRLLFLAVSAVGTVGMSHDPISFVGTPLYVLSIATAFGRIAPLLVLWWLARRPWDDERAFP